MTGKESTICGDCAMHPRSAHPHAPRPPMHKTIVVPGASCATSQYKINPEFGPLYVILARPRVAPRVVLDERNNNVQLDRTEKVAGWGSS